MGQLSSSSASANVLHLLHNLRRCTQNLCAHRGGCVGQRNMCCFSGRAPCRKAHSQMRMWMGPSKEMKTKQNLWFRKEPAIPALKYKRLGMHPGRRGAAGNTESRTCAFAQTGQLEADLKERLLQHFFL